MPVACSLYDLDDGFETDELHDQLDGLEAVIEDKSIDKLIDNEIIEKIEKGDLELKVTTTALRRQGDRLSCTLEYDTLKPRGHRVGEQPWYKDVERFAVQFSNRLFDNGGFITLGSKSKRGSAMLHMQDALDIGPDDYERRKISTSVIESLVSEDSKDSKTRTVEDYDEYTESATASGRLDEAGSLGDDLEDKGNTTWEMYESLDYDGVLGVSTETVVFYGNLWEEEIRMRYLEEKVAPKIINELSIVH